MLFGSIVGQEVVKKKLIRSVAENRVGHALLLSGPEGNGALALAVAFARYLNCTARTPEDSCGTCPSCRKFARLAHPDLHFVFPVVRSASSRKALSDEYLTEWRETLLADPYLTYERWLGALDSENKQAGIFVDESDQIVRKLQLTSYEGLYKVIVFWLPEKLNQQAANKILKILEEPPARTVFLMVSEAPLMLLPTLRSRMQEVEVPPLDDAVLMEQILPLMDGDAGRARLVVQNACGSLPRALLLARPEEDEEALLQQFANLMRGSWAFIHKANIGPFTEWCEMMAGLKREQHKMFLSYALRMVRECFVISVQPTLAVLSPGEQEFLRRFRGYISVTNAGALANELSLALRDIEANGNKNLVFWDLGMKVGALLPSIASSS